MEKFNISWNGLSIEEVTAQIRSINKFPCMIHIYDRVLKLDNIEEAYSFADGLDTGWYLKEEKLAREHKIIEKFKK